MSQSLSSRQLERYNKNVADPIVALLTIYGEGLTDDILISSDATTFLGLDDESKEPMYATISQGKTFRYVPFSIIIPDQRMDSAIPRASISIENVDSRIYATIRALPAAPSILIQVVYASEADTVVHRLFPMRLGQVNTTILAVSAELAPDTFLSEPCPAAQFYPSSNPSLIKAQ